MSYLRAIGSIFLVSFAIDAFAQTGTGLTGKYHDTETFGPLKTTRTDASIDFNFDRAIPSGTGIAAAMTDSVSGFGGSFTLSAYKPLGC
jgi:hypothetical protein